ncbi:dephospho-CoA kinase [Flavobacterium orientale]|uniref:Dephospho-CoA kinase n=1 Tax=Flavobacterium orientale TaxID=1756020 RepID=A0A917DA65_9FLAO|nr:dephospho-CoA kinase [Flavobacterium orientale]GGD16744.1 dephospho-CoA kinase [Flavobacterium orientale]
MTKLIGLTGGIGSGKTTLANYIASKGIPVYIADMEAKKLLEKPKVVAELIASFGETIKDENGISKEKLSKLVFDFPEKLKQLNAIIHPKVAKHFKKWLSSNQNHPIVVKEAAILFESGAYKDCDIIITIIAPEKIRIQRVIERDKTSEELVKSRIKNQWSDEQKMALSTYVVLNENLIEAKKHIDEILVEIIES